MGPLVEPGEPLVEHAVEHAVEYEFVEHVAVQYAEPGVAFVLQPNHRPIHLCLAVVAFEHCDHLDWFHSFQDGLSLLSFSQSYFHQVHLQQVPCSNTLKKVSLGPAQLGPNLPLSTIWFIFV